MMRFARLLACCLWVWGLIPAWSQTPAAPEVAARAYILVDVSAGQVLAEQQADEPVEPASLTKLMTAYVVFDALKSQKISLQQTLPVSTRAWKMPGSRMFIDPKMSVPVEDLLRGMIVQSGNDATIALAEGVGGTVERFVELMNQQAKALGMTKTSYKNPEGLTEPGHTTTARDLATLAQRLMRDFPDRLAYYAIKKYRYAGTPAANDTNRNLLLFRDPSVDGLKTGYTQAAGYCMVATAQREVPGLKSRRLLSIVLGAASENARAQESQKLLNWGYTAFDAVKLFDANQAVLQAPVWKGRANQLPLGRPEPVVVSVPSGQAAKLRSEVARPDPLVAPFTKGQAVAKLRIYVGEQLLTEKPLLALDGVDESGVVGRAWDAIRLWIK
jgi:serine-type D-Ala-D-Ala carboxypeptidase (penicillin-binding protein 5/6)